MGFPDIFKIPESDAPAQEQFSRAAVVSMIKVVAEYFVSAILAEEIAMGDVPALPKAAFPSVGNWTREQLKLAFYFYCETPFGKLHSRNPKIIELANQLGDLLMRSL